MSESVPAALSNHPLVRSATIALVTALWLAISGCGPRVAAPQPTPEQQAAAEVKITAEAYVFNSRLKRDGKPTTVKLELYHADTVIGLAGRAYLGKGALKGRLTADSLVVYFPASNEYVSESLGDLAARADCPIPLTQLHLLELFKRLPDSMDLPPEVTVAANYQDDQHPSFVIFVEGCPWQVEVEYQHHDEGWRPRRFVFEDGERLSFKAELERFKGNAEVPSGRFRPVIPLGSGRLSP